MRRRTVLGPFNDHGFAQPVPRATREAARYPGRLAWQPRGDPRYVQIAANGLLRYKASTAVSMKARHGQFDLYCSLSHERRSPLLVSNSAASTMDNTGKEAVEHVDRISLDMDRERQSMPEHILEPSTGEKLDLPGNLDYSGAVKKTDPTEIKLVKKLDWYIMPT